VGIRINTNVAALSAHRHLQNATWRVSRSMERLSSGLRINRAADDAAGLAISEGLKSDIRALDVTARNAADGISLVQTAEGALGSISEILIRLKELTVQASNGTLSAEQRLHLDDEFQALKDEVDRIGNATEFNGVQLLDGSAGVINIHVGISTAPSSDIAIDLGTAFDTTGLIISTLDVTDPTGVSAAPVLIHLEAAMGRVNHGRARLGAIQNRLESSIRVNMNLRENLSAANSRIRDVDIAQESSSLTSAQILQQMAIAVLGQANSMPAMALRLLGI